MFGGLAREKIKSTLKIDEVCKIIVNEEKDNIYGNVKIKFILNKKIKILK